MKITVKFFASLKEQVGQESMELSFEDQVPTVESAWNQATTLPFAPHVKVAINQAYAERTSTLKDGDELAFFPPVTGG